MTSKLLTCWPGNPQSQLRFFGFFFLFLIWISRYYNIICWKYFPLPLDCLSNFVENQITIQVWICFWDSSSIPLSLFFFGLSHAALMMQNYSKSLNLLIFLKYFRFLDCYIYFRIIFRFLQIKSAKTMIKISLNLQIKFEITNILKIPKLSIYKWYISAFI